MSNPSPTWIKGEKVFIECRTINCMNRPDDEIRVEILKIIRKPSRPQSIALTSYSGNLISLLEPIEDDVRKSGVENFSCDTHRVGYF